YLPLGFDPEIHRPVELTIEERAKLGCDVATFGNWYPYRMRLLESLAGHDLRIYGATPPRWLDHPLTRKWAGRPVLGIEKCKAMLAAKVTVNTSHYAAVDAVNKRTFELAAMGAFQLCNAPAIADVFEPDVEVVTFRDRDDM